ncbi:MAG TPA: carboxypeptidase-like regulatory domain-containing protein [Bacteroidales bacterium]|nr:carboxypeptidase-like regulatory domain-containing protein [Bacteroidales bacterium]
MLYRSILKKVTILILTVISLIISESTEAQFVKIADRVIIAGYVFEESTELPLPYVNVYIKKTRSGTITDTTGYFLITATVGDTIVFSSLGFDKKYVFVNEEAGDNTKPLVIFLDMKIYELKSVEIIALKRYKQLEYEITNMKLPENDYSYAISNFPFRPADIDFYTRSSTPTSGIGIVFSPITALYDMFSKEGKEKQKLMELQQKDYLNSIIDEKISTAMVMKITGLSKQECNIFLNWCNFSSDFLLKLSEYDLISVIVYKYKQYHIQKN